MCIYNLTNDRKCGNKLIVYIIQMFIEIGLLIILLSSYCNKSILGEFKHEVRQFQKPYDNQQAEQISLMV